ncbi:ZINC FINGER PROTEIN CONSTANS-LIKE 5 [Salix purpurea]|uniref:ZINC FINGER PROTEIN CONSTANS-LIKE 5 n=1 Tax=Salix purpurea TaxID=77065 RepID=A0A9Q0T301_SALPP|nr:ZINC FINGER PROTEIN CONSTANS-LIKE 5 [Salix purpurea]
MGIVVENLRNLTGGWRAAAKRCDSCKTEAAAAFCRVDSAFLCLNCDTKIHHSGVSSKIMSRHERVWMCEVCEQAPAVVTCKADAAALCVTCDADIHSANPLARRHERVPVEPFYDSAESIVRTSSEFNFLVPAYDHNDEVEGISWLLHSNHTAHDLNCKLHIENPAAKTEDMFFSELDPFLDLEYQNPMDGSYKQSPGGGGAGADSVVPVQNKPAPLPAINHKNCFDIDFCRSNLTSFSSYPSHSLSHSVSSSSLDVGVVPDGNSMSDISYPFGRSITTFTNPSMPISSGSSTNQAATQLAGTDREARVLRYRERRKNRKFEKTIRYASRKAYAETRPRIKGRFAKRTEMESDMDSLYSSTSSVPFLADTQYGVVPSF